MLSNVFNSLYEKYFKVAFFYLRLLKWLHLLDTIVQFNAIINVFAIWYLFHSLKIALMYEKILIASLGAILGK